MIKRVEVFLSVVTAIVVSAIFLSAVSFSKESSDYSYFLSTTFRLSAVLVIVLVAIKLIKTRFFNKYAKYIGFLLIIVALLSQVIFLLTSYRYVMTDTAYVATMVGRVIEGNHNWLEYFNVYPNNVNITIFWAYILKPFHLLGFNQYFVIISWLQMIFLDLGLLYLTQSIRKVNKKIGTIFFFLFLFYLPIFSYSIFAYNDIIAIMLTMIVMGALLNLSNSSNRNSSILNTIILFAAISLAVALRQNSAIILIALFLVIFFIKNFSWKKKALLILFLFATVLGINKSFNTIAKFEGYKPNVQVNTPTVSWINMSWNPSTSGQIESHDSSAYNNLPKAERTKALKNELHERLNEMGPLGVAEHLIKKISYMFSIGASNEDIMPLLISAPFIHSANTTDLIITVFVNIFQPFYILILALSLFGVYAAYKKKSGLTQNLDSLLLLSLLSIIGLFGFHILLWEVRDRYAIQLFPFILLFTSLGIEYFISKYAQKLTENNKLIESNTISIFGKVVLFMALLFNLLSYSTAIGKNMPDTAAVYKSGFLLYTENSKEMATLSPNSVYTTDEFLVKKSSNRLEMFFDGASLSELQSISFEVKNIDENKVWHFSAKNGWPVYTGNFSKGNYVITLKNNNNIPVKIHSFQDMGTKNIQGPAIKRNGQTLDGLNMNFSFLSERQQPFFTKKSLSIIFGFYMLPLLLTLIPESKKKKF